MMREGIRQKGARGRGGLGKPSVNTLRENFSSNHNLKMKLSIFRTTLYFPLGEIQFYPGNARKYLTIRHKLILSVIPAVSKSVDILKHK